MRNWSNGDEEANFCSSSPGTYYTGPNLSPLVYYKSKFLQSSSQFTTLASLTREYGGEEANWNATLFMYQSFHKEPVQRGLYIENFKVRANIQNIKDLREDQSSSWKKKPFPIYFWVISLSKTFIISLRFLQYHRFHQVYVVTKLISSIPTIACII